MKPRCGDCSNWRDVEAGQCRSKPPLTIVVPALSQVIEQPGNGPRAAGVQIISYWPPVRADESGCGEFTPKFHGGAAARL